MDNVDGLPVRSHKNAGQRLGQDREPWLTTDDVATGSAESANRNLRCERAEPRRGPLKLAPDFGWIRFIVSGVRKGRDESL